MKAVYWNGRIVPESHVLIPFEDAGFLYGEGVFTTLRVKDGQPHFLDAHFERLRKHSLLLKLPDPQIDERAILDLIALNNALKGNFRLKLIRTKGQEIASIDPYASLEGLPCRLRKEPFPFLQSSAGIKSLAYLDRKWAREKAQGEGFDDSVLSCPLGYWLETGAANLFWREGGKFYIPSQTDYYLKGIMLSQLMKVKHMEPAKHNPSEQANLYICNSLHGVRPVTEVQGFRFTRDFDLEKEWLPLVK